MPGKKKYSLTDKDKETLNSKPEERKYLKLKTIQKLREYNAAFVLSLEKLISRYSSEALMGALESAKNAQDFLDFLRKYYKSNKKIYRKLEMPE